jgi:hypothetical protein
VVARSVPDVAASDPRQEVEDGPAEGVGDLGGGVVEDVGTVLAGVQECQLLGWRGQPMHLGGQLAEVGVVFWLRSAGYFWELG